MDDTTAEALASGQLRVADFGSNVEAVEVRHYADTNEPGEAFPVDECGCDLIVTEYRNDGTTSTYDHCKPWSRNVRDRLDVVEGIGLRYTDGTTASYLTDDPAATELVCRALASVS